MNVTEMTASIVESLPACVTCGDVIDIWPDADESERGRKLIYSARDALFAGCCQSGHVNEFYLSEVKEEEYTPHDLTERTLGRFTPQSECPHKRHVFCQIQDGQQVPGIDGMIFGPATVKFCGSCGMRKVHKGKTRS